MLKVEQRKANVLNIVLPKLFMLDRHGKIGTKRSKVELEDLYYDNFTCDVSDVCGNVLLQEPTKLLIA